MACGHCKHPDHPVGDCMERICDAAGDIDWCPCPRGGPTNNLPLRRVKSVVPSVGGPAQPGETIKVRGVDRDLSEFLRGPAKIHFDDERRELYYISMKRLVCEVFEVPYYLLFGPLPREHGNPEVFHG